MPPILGLLVLAGVLVAAGAALTRKSSQLPSGPVGRFVGQLRKGQFYRLWARVIGKDTAITQDDLRARIERMGFTDTRLITVDPTDPAVVTLLTRWGLDSSEVFDTPDVRLFQLEAVEEPPANVRTSGEADGHPSLDGGLTAAEVDAIKWALVHDDDPKHLGGFASTFEPDFPIAASLLRAKAALANARSMGSVLASQLREKNAKMAERFGRAAQAVGVGHGATEWARKLASNTLGTLRRLTDKLVPSTVWDKYTSSAASVGVFLPAHRMWMSDKAFSVLKQVSEATSDVGEEGESFAKQLCEASPTLAMVPKLGSGVACMRAAGAALSVATSLETVNMQDEAALIHHLSSESEATAFLTAADLVGGFARGQLAPGDGLFALLTRERQGLTDTEKVAFDAGTAIGFARALQATDFPALWSYAQGDSLSARALHFAVAVGKAKREKKRTVAVLLGQLSAAVPASALDVIRSLAIDLIKDEKLLRLYPKELANEKGVPVPVAAAALAIVREIGEGIRVVDPTALRLIVPSESSFSLGLTPAALKLAMSMTKPYVSQVINPGAIVPKVRAIAKGEGREAAKARQQLERASRVLERQRWADWYRKVQTQKGNPNTIHAGTESGQLTRSNVR